MGGNSMSALQDPIYRGDPDALKQVLDSFGIAAPLLLDKQFTMTKNAVCLEMDPIFTTPLKYCISCDEPDCLRVLLEAGGNPHERGKGGVTLLHKACKKISVSCVKVLLEYGARIHDCDEWGVYPIHVCVGSYGDSPHALTILEILLEAGNSTDINLQDTEYGKFPLHYAAFHGNKNICQRLLDLGVDINAKDKHGRTAYQAGQRHVQNFLKDKGCEVPEPVKKNPLPPLFPLRNSVSNSTCNEKVESVEDGSAVRENSEAASLTSQLNTNTSSHEGSGS